MRDVVICLQCMKPMVKKRAGTKLGLTPYIVYYCKPCKRSELRVAPGYLTEFKERISVNL